MSQKRRQALEPKKKFSLEDSVVCGCIVLATVSGHSPAGPYHIYILITPLQVVSTSL